MEEKVTQQTNNKNRIYVIVIIILSLLLVALLGYIITDKAIEQEKNKNPDPTNTPTIEPTKTPEPSPEETKAPEVFTEDAAKQVYRSILHKSSTDDIHKRSTGDGLSYDYFIVLYNKEKNIIADLFDYNTKMAISYKKLERENKVIKTYNDVTYNTTLTFLSNDIKQAYKFYFGVEPELVTFDSYPTGSCTLASGIYTCILPPSGGLSGPTVLLNAFDSYKYENDTLYVYEKAMYLETDSNIYKTEINGTPISELTGLDPSIITDNNYSSYFMKYLHTFKKSPEGTFYLYSSEFVE